MELTKPIEALKVEGATLTATAMALPAMAQTVFADAAWTPPIKGDWLVTGGVTDVFSGADDTIRTNAGADSGLHADPELHILRDRPLGGEGILGTTKHEIRAQGGTTDVVVNETSVGLSRRSDIW